MSHTAARELWALIYQLYTNPSPDLLDKIEKKLSTLTEYE